MKEHPILFSEAMVKAILEGRKTQTRRIVKGEILQSVEFLSGRCDGVIATTEDLGQDWKDGENWIWCAEYPEEGGVTINCPYGKPGDRLWVKETWRVGAWAEDDGKIAVDYKAGDYCRREWLRVDNDELFTRLWKQSTDDASRTLGVLERYDWKPGESPCRWRPSIFMPRLAARIILEIVNIKIERLQDITVTECLKEGTHSCRPLDDFGKERIVFKGIWDSINRQKASWDNNPWVWVIEFKNTEDKRMSPSIAKVIKQGEDLVNK